MSEHPVEVKRKAGFALALVLFGAAVLVATISAKRQRRRSGFESLHYFGREAIHDLCIHQSAQRLFKEVSSRGTYAESFVQLYATEVGGERINLISESMANANAEGKAVPRVNYLYQDVRFRGGKEIDYTEGFALCGFPRDYNAQTRYTYIVSEDGPVYCKDTGGEPVESFPFDPEAEGWAPVEA